MYYATPQNMCSLCIPSCPLCLIFYHKEHKVFHKGHKDKFRFIGVEKYNIIVSSYFLPSPSFMFLCLFVVNM